MSQGFTQALSIPLSLSNGGTGAALTLPVITKVNVQRVTTTGAGTYTPSTGMKYVIVCAQAGGAGGGGAATSGAGQGACGGGGSGGEYIEALFTASDIGASKAFSVGAKGTGGAAGNNAGNNGSNTTFNTTWIIATGGTGGGGGAATAGTGVLNVGIGGATGGSVATGTLIKQNAGNPSGPGIQIVASNAYSGSGGASGDGSGGGAGKLNASIAGSSGLGKGSGGSGASTNNGAQQPGGDGADGYITFIEFISI